MPEPTAQQREHARHILLRKGVMGHAQHPVDSPSSGHDLQLMEREIHGTSKEAEVAKAKKESRISHEDDPDR